MKKFLLACVCLSCFVGVGAFAAPSDCAYTQLQSLVRDARDAKQIKELMAQGVSFEDPQIRCGGTLIQLAVVRGNHEILRALLEQDIKRATHKVSLAGYPIPGAPKEVPVLLFTAYHAPNENIMTLMVQALEALGMNLNITDSNGRDLMWYLEKNPVLRKTAIADELHAKLLSGLASRNETLGGSLPPVGTPANLGNAPQQASAVRQGVGVTTHAVQKEMQFNGFGANQPVSQQLPPLAGETKPSAGENLVEPTAQ